jgi:hypothetical protein
MKNSTSKQLLVIPAKAGTQRLSLFHFALPSPSRAKAKSLGSRLRGNDDGFFIASGY